MSAARTSGCASKPECVECLIFCAAARAAVEAGSWSDTLRLAPMIEASPAPLEAAYQLGIDRWLGINVSPPRRAVFALRRLLRRPNAA